MIARVWNRVKQKLSSKSKRPGSCHTPKVIPASQHKIKRSNVSVHALNTVERLQKAGYQAYFVGGSVRDLLLGRKPKDYDIATDAKPNQVKQLFRRSRVIGRRFKLVHVYFKGEIIEVATFRADIRNDDARRSHSDEGMILTDNVYGTVDEDAWRRDFTINAFYYDPTQNIVLDYVGGIDDLRGQRVATIGLAAERFQEDPVRLLRALRFAAKLGFELEDDLKQALLSQHDLLHQVPGSRLYDAFIQVFFAGYAEKMYGWMRDTGYFERMFPDTTRLVSQEKHQDSAQLIVHAMRATDARYHEGKSLNPGFLLSVILWPPLMQSLHYHKRQGHKFYQALHMAIEEVLVKHQSSLLVLPSKTVAMIRSIWMLQFALRKRRPSRVHGLVEQRYFRAAFDLMEMRSHFEKDLLPVVQWWTKFQRSHRGQRERMIKGLIKER